MFPLTPMSKVPLPRSKGFKDATTDPDQIRTWWAQTPDANIGIATGHLVDVIDIDGPTGAASWYSAMWDDNDNYAGPPPLGKVTTPRPGGQHIYVAADPTRTNHAAAILPGVDQRARGGYVVAPPSVTEAGTYQWLTPLSLEAV